MEKWHALWILFFSVLCIGCAPHAARFDTPKIGDNISVSYVGNSSPDELADGVHKLVLTQLIWEVGKDLKNGPAQESNSEAHSKRNREECHHDLDKYTAQYNSVQHEYAVRLINELPRPATLTITKPNNQIAVGLQEFLPYEEKTILLASGQYDFAWSSSYGDYTVTKNIPQDGLKRRFYIKRRN